MLALSDSNTISVSPSSTVSPTETETSITSTSDASPISGTFTFKSLISQGPYANSGLSLLISMPKSLMALVTTAGLISPFSAKAFNAATTM